ncbi:MAG: glutaredoxin family protein [Candidatus ainarchaeum sp.]|nr:glutaredoxin family protein [Candidatus ainarchaeum sp.]
MSKIIVYSTTMCPYCVMVKDWLKSKKVSYEDINVGIDHDKAKKMIEKSGQSGVPVIEIDDEIIIGFDRAKIEEVLKSKKLI